MKKSLKIINLLSISLILFLAIFCFTGCVSGVVSEQQYSELIDGVNAQDKDGNSVYYEMRTLVDDTQFNTNIQSKPYCRLDIYVRQSCQTKGVVFIVRSSEDCNLKFTTYINEEIKSTKTKEIKKGITTDIDMFFDTSSSCNSSSDFYIEIEEQNNEDEQLTSFQFDSLIIFLEE